jgi:hypothetical protein
MTIVLESLGELEQTRAQTEARTLGRIRADCEPHPLFVNEKTDDSTEAYEIRAVADG